MADIEHLKPIGRTIIVRKCINGERRDNDTWLGNLVVPDFVAENTGWAEIIAVSDQCRYFTSDMVGKTTHLPPWKPRHMRRLYDEFFIVKEELFDLSVKDGGADPYIYTG